MNRLRDEPGFDPISEKGIRMLRAIRRTSCPPGLKRRVWASLQQTSIGSPIRRRSSLLRALVVGIGLVAFTASAAATLGGRRLVSRIERMLGSWVGTAPARSEGPNPARLVAEAPSAASGGTPPGMAQPGPPEAHPETENRILLGGSLPPAPTHGGLRPSTAARPAATETSRERTQVLEALGALRRDHDPNRAAALLNHDLETNRHGVLRQEALVLAIEAADARGDHAGAERFARAYEREFPSGRFRQLVRSYLDEKNAQLRPVPLKQ
jgi:hypothetical protein